MFFRCVFKTTQFDRFLDLNCLEKTEYQLSGMRRISAQERSRSVGVVQADRGSR